MYLKHKDYTEKKVVEKTAPDVKEEIKSFVGVGKKRYEEIVKHIQVNNFITNDEIVKQIEEIKKTEADYKPVVEIVEEPIIDIKE